MNKFNQADQDFMDQALAQAERAADNGEVPVGAVVVLQGKVIGQGANSPISTNDPTHHAEIVALREAAQTVNNYRMPGAVMYVTLEPCAMCAGAIVHARIARVVCATKEPRAGAGGSVLNVLQHEQLNHRCEVEFGLQQERSAGLLKEFFQQRRKA